MGCGSEETYWGTVVSYTYVTISNGTGHRHDIEEVDAVLIF